MKPITTFFVGLVAVLFVELALIIALVLGLVIHDKIAEARARKAIQEFRQEFAEDLGKFKLEAQQAQQEMDLLMKKISRKSR